MNYCKIKNVLLVLYIDEPLVHYHLIQTTTLAPVIGNNAPLPSDKGQLNEVVTMTKAEMIQYLMSRYQVSYRIAQDALSDNDWDLMMAAGDIRDELNAEV